MSTTANSMAVTRTGIPSAKLGMWLFLASEVMFFAGLLGAYVVLRAGTAWPHPADELNVPAAALNTFILLSSSMTMALSVAATHNKDLSKLRLFLLATILLGIAFLCVKGYEYSVKFHHGHFPSTSLFFGTYFTLTGIHGIHVLAGIIANLWVLSLTCKPGFLERRADIVETSGLYWHFVDVVWIFLFPMVYLI